MREFSSFSASEIVKTTALDTVVFDPDKRIDLNRQIDRNSSEGYNVDKRVNSDVSSNFTDMKQDIADKVAKDYNGKTNPTELAKQKGYDDVIATKNGGISYEKSKFLYKKEDGTLGIVKIEATGNRSKDFDLANQMIGLDETPDGYVWHHLDDYDVKNNTITLQLVTDEAHNAGKKHMGGCAQYDAVHGSSYNPPRKEQ